MRLCGYRLRQVTLMQVHVAGEAAIKERARREGDTSDFAEDSVFSFPSTAADGVLGCSANGAVSRKMSRYV